MSKETVKASIEYAANHCGDEIAITFYGGEPLLKYDLIEYAVNYSRSLMADKKLTYSMTTNLTLMTSEMAEFFASIDGFSILCSIDGPEDVHDQYRKYENGNGSFNDAIRGLKHLAEAYGEDKLISVISLNMVFAPPYTAEKLKKIQAFFENLDWLPAKVTKSISYPNDGSISEEFCEIPKTENAQVFRSENPLLDWIEDELADGSGWDELFTNSFLTEALLPIHKRSITSEAMQSYGFNGCCVPGKTRLYIGASGRFTICSMMGVSPAIGDINGGLDRQSIKDLYLDDYEEKSIEDCNKCWAFKICKICYAGTYSNFSHDMDKKRAKCDKARNWSLRALTNYHEFMEAYPEKMAMFNVMTLG
jgi:uncharacterized protein